MKAGSITTTQLGPDAAEVVFSPGHNQHPGRFLVQQLDLAGTKLPCAVIDGPNGVQRVLSEHGITRAILGSRSGASKRLKRAADDGGALLPLFVAPGQLEPFITNDLRDGPLRPIDYLDGDRIVRGYDMRQCTLPGRIGMTAAFANLLQSVASFVFWPVHSGAKTVRENPWHALDAGGDEETHMVGDHVANYSFLSVDELDGVDSECIAHMGRSKLLSASEEL